MKGQWSARIAEGGVAVSMILLLGGLSQSTSASSSILAIVAAAGLVLFGILLIAAKGSSR